jgi:hypothetical protein
MFLTRVEALVFDQAVRAIDATLKRQNSRQIRVEIPGLTEQVMEALKEHYGDRNRNERWSVLTSVTYPNNIILDYQLVGLPT